MHMRLLSLALLAALSTGAAALAQPVTGPDEAAIRAVMDRQGEAWNRHDMEAFVAEMTPDVDWVNVVGMHWRGREQVLRAHQALHRTMFARSRVEPPESVEMRRIAPETILVVSTSGVKNAGPTPGGGAYAETGSRMTLVFVKAKDGRWQIAHGHNTTINVRALASDPAAGSRR